MIASLAMPATNVAMVQRMFESPLMLFLAGFSLGRYAGHARPLRSGLVMAVFGVALIGAVKALGG